MRFLIYFILAALILYLFRKLFQPSAKNKAGQDGPETKQGLKAGGYAKWVGGGVGWALGGPIGGILGFAFGKMFEDMKSGSYAGESTRKGDFNISLLVLSAAVMKADESLKRIELEYVKRFFNHNFGQAAADQYVLMLREILKQEIKLDEVCNQISQFMDYPSKLQLLHYLFGLALSDGSVHQAEMETISQISVRLGIRSADFASIKAMFVKDADSAYKILEISRNASDEEVKKAYRDMAINFHPDKVSHLGEEVRKAAEEKFKSINEAYEKIKRERGIK